MRKSKWRIVFLATACLLSGFATLLGVVTSQPALGTKVAGERRQRAEHSPEWRDGMFRNSGEMFNDLLGALRAGSSHAPESRPTTPVVHATTSPQQLAAPPESGLRVTWFGHSTSLIDIDGTRVLTDPIWSERASPVQWAGPSRYYAPTITLDDLPAIDAIVISHDHYDHLDYGTVSAMKDKTIFIVPLGVGAHLAHRGVADDHIVELDWWQSRDVGGVTITATPARHASGRFNPRGSQTLWAGYAMRGRAHNVYYSGDTGFFAELADIGTRLGPFDVTLIESGQYNAAWPDWHLGPEQAVQAHRAVRGIKMIPVHWALFTLAPHTWTEPVERVLTAARCNDVEVLTPRPGESIEPENAIANEHWWPNNAWQTAAEAPIVATKDGNANNRFTIPLCTVTSGANP